MSYVHDLAGILADATNSFQFGVNTIEDGIHAYMINYLRRGCTMKTIFNAYVDLIRFASDVEYVDNGGQSIEPRVRRFSIFQVIHVILPCLLVNGIFYINARD